MLARRTVLYSGLAVSIVGSLGIFLLVTAHERGSNKLSAAELPATETRKEIEHASPQLMTPARIPSPPSESVATFLREFWGTNWSAMEGKYLERGVKLNEAPKGLKPWDDVKSEIQTNARAYYERDRPLWRRMFVMKIEENDSFFSRFNVEEGVDKQALLTDLHAEVSDIDVELDSLTDQYMGGLDVALEHAVGRMPERYPAADLRPAEKQAGDFLRIDVESGGWYVTYHFTHDDFPGLDALQKEKGTLAARRDARIRTFMTNRRSGR